MRLELWSYFFGCNLVIFLFSFLSKFLPSIVLLWPRDLGMKLEDSPTYIKVSRYSLRIFPSPIAFLNFIFFYFLFLYLSSFHFFFVTFVWLTCYSFLAWITMKYLTFISKRNSHCTMYYNLLIPSHKRNLISRSLSKVVYLLICTLCFPFAWSIGGGCKGLLNYPCSSYSKKIVTHEIV